MTKGGDKPEKRPLDRLYALAARIRAAEDEAELVEIEVTIDEILKSELEQICRRRNRSGEATSSKSCDASTRVYHQPAASFIQQQNRANDPP